MRLLIKDRGKGKTTGLIHTSEATGYPIVVSTHIEAIRIFETAKKIDCHIPMPITVRELHNYPKNLTNVLIDEVTTILEETLKEYLNVDNIICATMSDNLKIQNPTKYHTAPPTIEENIPIQKGV